MKLKRGICRVAGLILSGMLLASCGGGGGSSSGSSAGAPAATPPPVAITQPDAVRLAKSDPKPQAADLLSDVYVAYR